MTPVAAASSASVSPVPHDDHVNFQLFQGIDDLSSDIEGPPLKKIKYTEEPPYQYTPPPSRIKAPKIPRPQITWNAGSIENIWSDFNAIFEAHHIKSVLHEGQWRLDIPPGISADKVTAITNLWDKLSKSKRYTEKHITELKNQALSIKDEQFRKLMGFVVDFFKIDLSHNYKFRKTLPGLNVLTYLKFSLQVALFDETSEKASFTALDSLVRSRLNK
jgi:hypothetical protein